MPARKNSSSKSRKTVRRTLSSKAMAAVWDGADRDRATIDLLDRATAADISALKLHARMFGTGLVRVKREKALVLHRRTLRVRASKFSLAA